MSSDAVTAPIVAFRVAFYRLRELQGYGDAEVYFEKTSKCLWAVNGNIYYPKIFSSQRNPIEPLSKEAFTEELARCLDRLSTDHELAERMSLAARKTAETWRWSTVVKDWLSLYRTQGT